MNILSFVEHLNFYHKRFCFLLLLFLLSLLLSSPARQRAASQINNAGVPKDNFQQALIDPGPSVVSVNGRQLIVQKRNPDGTLEPAAPYIIRGVNWSPASQNTNTSTTDPNNANVRRPEFANWAATDIPLMRNMNVNTVRMFIDPGIDANGRAVLDQLYSNRIMVIMTVDDANNNTARVQQAVNFYKDHPAVLMWMLGNEWNINRYYTNPPISVAEAAQRTQQAAALIKTLDTVHPVATSYGEIDIDGGLSTTQGFINQTCLSVDIWALNIYRGNTFGTLFEQWSAISSKPMFIGEFGTDAFRSFNPNPSPPGVVDEASQSQWVLSLWNDLFKNLSSPNGSKAAIGGCVFEFSDEWWKVQPSGSQQTGGFFSANGHPDQFGNEEYFGIVDINRQPRLLYQTLTTAFASNYQPPYSITYRAMSRGSAAQEYSSQNGVCRFIKDGQIIHQVTGGAGGGRGLNVAVMDPCTGELKQPIQNFDTWSSRNTGTAMIALTNFLISVPNGDMVLIAVADEAGLNQFPPNDCVSLGYSWIEPFYQAIESLGGTRIRQYCYRNSWAMSAIKGNPQTAQEQLMTATEANASLALPIQTTISPNSHFFTQHAGTSGITITSPSSCSWTAVSNNTEWLNIISGTSGTGNGVVNFAATANSGYLRAETMTVAGQPFVVTQGCKFTVNPASQNFPSTGGSNGNFTVSTDVNCAWTATSEVNWITFPNGNTGSGNGTVNYSVAANSGTNQRTGSINVNGQVHLVTQSGAPTNIQVTVQTNPVGRSFTVDGTPFSSTQVFNWTPGSSHTIATTSTQAGATGTQYVWANWSDGGAISHTVAPTMGTTYTANFTTQHQLTTSANPTNGGTVSPPGGNWYNAGQIVSIMATAGTGFTFNGWTGSGPGSYTGPNNPASVTMNGPITETANFMVAAISVTVQTNPVGRSFTVDGTPFTSTQVFNWTAGSSHTIATTSPQAGTTGTQHVWSNWSDGGAISHTVAPTTGTTYTASFTTQHQLTMNPGTGGTTNPPTGSQFYNAGQIVSIMATAGTGFTFNGWTGSGTGSYTGPNNPASVTMNGPITETPTFANVPCTYSLTPISQNFPSSGGNGSVQVNTQLGCTWTAVSNSVGFSQLTGVEKNLGLKFKNDLSDVISITAGNPLPTGKITENNAMTATFPGTGIGAIPDATSPGPQVPGTPLNISFNVAGFSGAPTNVEVNLTGTHTFVGDLKATLLAPNGNTFTVFGYTGATSSTSFGSGSDLSGTYNFKDSAAGTNWWTAAAISPVQAGDYRTTVSGPTVNPAAVTNLTAAFAGVANPNGNWTLRITDGASFDTGSISAANLTLTEGNSALWITITSGQSGTGSGTVNYSVAANVTGQARTGTIAIAGQTFIVNQSNSGPTNGRSFDFDGDNRTDVSIFRPSVGEWWYFRSSDGTNRAFQFGQGADKIVAADYTGDGRSDVAFWRPSSGEWFILRSEDSSFYAFPFGGNGDIPVPADYDGDGKADPAVFRPSSATWFIIRSSDGGTTIQSFGANGDRPVPADYDGDSKADLAIFRPSDGTWWLNRSQAGIIVTNFGVSTDKNVPGDYTGDGKADVAFFRPSSGEWYVLRSEDFSFYAFPFGAPGDVPTPGDYDGDGKIDPTVFRPSNNTWFKLQSTSGFEAITFGITNDIPVPSAFVR